jgi:rhomboid protease GluP
MNEDGSIPKNPSGSPPRDPWSVPGPQAPAAPPPVSIRMPSGRPVVSYILLGGTTLVYLLQVASQYLVGVDLPALYGMKINQAILAGQYWRLITPMFLHGSILHIAFNMYALYAFGPTLERYFGRFRFLALYFLSGFAGNIASFIFSPAASLGSSTAIFGLLAAEGIFLYQNRKLFKGVAQRAITQVVTIAAVNLVIGLSPGIDNWGHVGGLLGGALFTWLAGPLLAVEGVYPDLALVDQREPAVVWQATIGVGVLLIAIAAGAIYLKGGRLP